MKHTVTGQSDRPHRTPAATRVPSRSSTPASVAFVDNRPESIAQRRLADAIHNSQQQLSQRRATDAIHNSPFMVAQRQQLHGVFGEAAQLQAGPEEEELLQGKFAAVQRQAGPEEEELLQGKFEPVQRAEAEQDRKPRENNTGLPDHLKPGIESLSGMSMDADRVHYNSSQPAQLNALAYAQGTDIHVAPGQEQHLPHEAWHVVQQAQGRVKPTMQMKDGVPVNDDAGLEHEADVMGAKALVPAAQIAGGPEEEELLQGKSAPEGITQRDPADAVNHSPRVVAQARRLDGLFGAAQLRPDPASASLYCPLQRKTIEDMGITGVAKAGIRRLVGDDTRAVSVYTAPVVPDKSREEAITSSSGVNAAIGKQLPPNKWTPKRKTLPTAANVQTLDPFILETHGGYTSPNPTDFILSYQHASGFQGYVTGVTEGGARSEMISKPTPGKSEKQQGKYGFQHEVQDAKLIDASTGDKDAITKIAGEGARWQCVRAHAGLLKDTTKFYVHHEDKFFAVTFRQLWRTWKKSFRKSYDIPDSAVADKLRAKTLEMEDGTKVGDVPYGEEKILPDDYNLDNPKAAKEMEFV